MVTSKRGNGEGSRPRRRPDGRWEARYTIHTSKGPKRKTVYGRTRQEVADKLAHALSDRTQGLTFDAGSLKLSEYLDRWLPDIRDRVRQRTWERYEQIVRVHIKPALGRVKLKALAPTHVRGLYREKLDAGLSCRTVQYIHTTLHKSLKDAVSDGLVPRNVAEGIKPPRPKKKEITPLNPEQAQVFLAAARGDRFEALYVLAIHCGLREGELLGLKWDDVNLETNMLRVRRTLSETRSGYIFEPPKNGKGRAIKLTQAASDALRGHLERQLEEIDGSGDNYQDQGLIFPSRKGTPMNARDLTGRSFKPILKRAGLPDIRLHDLRHTCATLMLCEGVHVKLVQELLGHATISITLDTYSHLLPGMGDEATGAMDRIFSR
ncbi:MAG: site-specific integrase [Pyrinomonadaceae bacterium]|nr:site-specific integrase [Pyrinomonadaceae bacterium]